MSLQFNPGAYESVYENSQNRNQQSRRDLANSINSVPEALLQYVQQQKQQEQQGRQNRLGDLTAGIQVANAGGDPNAALSYLSGTGIADQPKPMDQAVNPSPGPWSNPQPEDMPAASTGGNYATPPAPLLKGPASSGRGVLDHWDQTMPHMSSKTTLGDVFPNQQQDYGDVINKMAGGDYSGFQKLTPKQQSLVQNDPRYKQAIKPKPDNLNYAQAKLIVPTLDEKGFNAAYPDGIPKEHLSMMSKPTGLSTMNTSTYATAPADDQRLARNLVDGRIRPSDIGYRDRGRIVSLASEYADMQGKDFQSFGGDVNAGMAKNLAYGKMGQNTLSLNTALGHIGDASKAYDQLQNTNQQWLNIPINKLKRMTNDPAIVALDLKLNAVAGEMATTFKSGGATDQEIGHFANVLNDNLTPSQAHAALQSAGELLNSRLNALQNQQSSVRGSNGSQRELISPHGKDVMNQFNDAKTEPITQRNKKTGQIRTSQDGGQTWQIQ